MQDRILFVLLAALVAYLPFEFRSFPLLSNLQWLFVGVSVAAIPILIRHRKTLSRNRLVIAALLFVLTQWLAALLADEFKVNAIKAAVRVTAGFTLLCISLCVRNGRPLFRVWSVSAILAALYAVLDYSGLGAPWIFRETEFWFGPDMRLSGSFEHPNAAAAFFSLSLPIVWTSWQSRWPRIVGSLLIWIVLMLTYSRGAVIAVLLIMVIWGLRSRRTAAIYLGGLAVGTFTLFLATNPSMFRRFWEPTPSQALSAQYEPEFNLLKSRPDEPGSMEVRVTNNGSNSWPANSANKNERFTLAYWWIDPKQGKPLRTPMIYTPIPLPVQPQESVSIRAPFHTPSEPGLYILTWDISHGRDWFSGEGVFPGLVEVDVQPGNKMWSGHGDISRWYRPEVLGLFVAYAPLSRSQLWKAALDMVRQHPIAGVGPDNFRLLYGRHFGLPDWDKNIRSNSLYLELLCGSGLLGLAAFILMMAVARRSVPIWIFLIHGLVDVFLMTTPIYFAFWILLGQADNQT